MLSQPGTVEKAANIALGKTQSLVMTPCELTC